MKTGRLDTLALAALLGSVFCWAAIPVMLRDLTAVIDAWTANGVRYPMAALCYWPVLYFHLRQQSLTLQHWAQAAAPACLTFLGQIFWALAPYYLTASAIGFLVKAAVAWGLLAAMWLFPRERILLRSAQFYIGLLLGLGGFAGLASVGLADASWSPQGILIILACSLFFGLYGVSVRFCLANVPPMLAFGMVAQFVSLGTISLMAWNGGPHHLGSLDGRTWLVLVCSAVLGIGLGHVLYYFAVQRIGAAIPTAVNLVSPFVTLVLAHLLLGEEMGTVQWLAGVAMVVGGGFLFSAQRTMSASAT